MPPEPRCDGRADGKNFLPGLQSGRCRWRWWPAGWLRGGNATRKLLLEATAAGLVGRLFAHIIGLAWQHPRPFMVGIGRTLIPHAADSSFPSDHLTLL